MKTLFEETTEKLDEIYMSFVDPNNKDQVLKIIEALKPIFEHSLPEKRKTEKERKRRVRGVMDFKLGDEIYRGENSWRQSYEKLMVDKLSHLPFDILVKYLGDRLVVNDVEKFADHIKNNQQTIGKDGKKIGEKSYFTLNKEKNIHVSISHREYVQIERLEKLCKDLLGQELKLIKRNP